MEVDVEVKLRDLQQELANGFDHSRDGDSAEISFAISDLIDAKIAAATPAICKAVMDTPIAAALKPRADVPQDLGYEGGTVTTGKAYTINGRPPQAIAEAAAGRIVGGELLRGTESSFDRWSRIIREEIERAG